MQQTQESENSRLPNLILKQKLAPIPLLKQSFVTRSTAELEFLKPEQIFHSPKNDSKKYNKKLGKLVLDPSNDQMRQLFLMFNQQIHFIKINSILSKIMEDFAINTDTHKNNLRPFLEFTSFHQRQLLGGASNSRSHKRLPPITSGNTENQDKLGKQLPNSVKANIVVQDHSLPTETKYESSNDNRSESQLNMVRASTALFTGPDIKLKTFVKKVLKFPSFGVLIHFSSIYVNLEILDQSDLPNKEKDEKGRRRRNKRNHVIKLDIGTLETLLDNNIFNMISILKKSIKKKENNEFEIDLALLSSMKSEKDFNIENEFPAESHKEIVNIDYNNYNVWIQFPYLELYVPELNHNEKLLLKRDQLRDLISNNFNNLAEYALLFDFAKNSTEITNSKDKSNKKKYLLLLGENDTMINQLYETAENIINSNKHILFKMNINDQPYLFQDQNLEDDNLQNINNIKKAVGVLNKFGIKQTIPDELKNDVKKFNIAEYLIVFFHLTNNHEKLHRLTRILNILLTTKLNHKGFIGEGKKLLLIATVDKEYQGLTDNFLHNQNLIRKELYRLFYKSILPSKLIILEHFILYLNFDNTLDLINTEEDHKEKTISNLQKFLLDINDLQILDFAKDEADEIAMENQKRLEQLAQNGELDAEKLKEQLNKNVVENFNIIFEDASTPLTIEELKSHELKFHHEIHDMKILTKYINISIKLERETDPNVFILQDIYQMNLLEFYELLKLSEELDINIYLMDKFDIQRNVSESENDQEKYMLHNKKLHQETLEIEPYQILDKNIDNGLLNDINFTKAQDNIAFRFIITYPYVLIEDNESKDNKIIKLDKILMNEVLKRQFNFKISIAQNQIF